MVLKKTNCHNVNSGNTMKKRCYNQLFAKKKSTTNHIIKMLHNSRFVTAAEKQEFEIDPADSYLDDGGLKTSGHSRGFNFSFHDLECYSLNKKRRWQVEANVSDALLDLDLQEESFKITLVCRTVPYYDGDDERYFNERYFNVVRYYDSQSSENPESPVRAKSSRQDLLKRALKLKRTQVDKGRQRKEIRRQGHNQHFRSLQRKAYRVSSKEVELRDNADDVEELPEIRYEVAEAEELNSKSFKNCSGRKKYMYYYWPCQRGTRFRGVHRDKVESFCVDSCCRSFSRKDTSINVSGCYNDSYDDEKDSQDILCEEYSCPSQQQFSLLDLASATERKQLRASKRQQHTAKEDRNTNTSCVNSASSQYVRKHGKGSAVYLQRDEEDNDDDEDSSNSSHGEEMETASEDVITQDEHFSKVSEAPSAIKVDYVKEFRQFENSFCSCRILQSEFSVACLRDAFGYAVQFANSIPFSARFNLHAVFKLLTGDGGNKAEMDDESWWLVCQAGDRLRDRFSSMQHTQEDVVMVNFKIYNSLDDSRVMAANLELRKVMQGEGHSIFLSTSSLLQHVCNIVADQLSCGRDTRSLTVTDLSCGPMNKRVTVCNLSEAYQHLKMSGKLSAEQVREDEDLDPSCSLTWCDIVCAVCLTTFDDNNSTTSGGLSPFVVMSDCGHCFCRQCWQHHLVSRILEGQTTFKCMEYKCQTILDSTTVMSLVPQWAFTRWQHRVHNVAVESSGTWKWCPNPKCSLLASANTSQKKQKSANRAGLPVTCRCSRQWCLDCGKDAHWPISCSQFNTYTKMLKQKGDEHGVKSTGVEFYYIQVKRCPGCNYPMEKNGGCSHMTCMRCSQHFCWECLAPWENHWAWGSPVCRVRAEETIELDNEKIYPLPIECYKKAVSFRYRWIHAMCSRRHNHRIITLQCMYSNRVIKGRRVKWESMPVADVASAVTQAKLFLQKGLRLLELSYILLSNTTRHHSCAKPLRQDIDRLDFICDRLSLHFQQTWRKLLTSWADLRRITVIGEQLIQVIHRRCCHLALQLDDKAQDWLLTGDHEKFVHYK